MHPVLIQSEIDVQSRIKTNIIFSDFHNSKYEMNLMKEQYLPKPDVFVK